MEKIKKPLGSISAKKNSGQAVVEYILMMALLVGIVTGVMWPKFSAMIEKSQNEIKSFSQSVIAQDSVGIPLAWFNVTGGDTNGFGSNPFGNSGQNNGPDSNAGKKSNSGPDDSNSSDGSGGLGSDSNPSARGRGKNKKNASNSNANSSNASSKAPTSDKDKDKDKDKDQDGNEKSPKNSSSSGGGSGGYGDVDGDAQNKKENELPSAVGGETGSKEKSDDVSTVSGKRKTALSRSQESETSSCNNMNVFTLLKIAAIVGLLLFAGALALGNQGKKDD